MADRLDLPGRNDPKADILRLVSDWLSDDMKGKWFMVIDNVDSVETFFPSQKPQRDETHASPPALLANYIPQSHNGSILITSRSKDAAARLSGGLNHTKEVFTMDQVQGLKLLHHKLQDLPTDEDAADLLQALDCIPLAISQAAAYINRRTRMTVASYLNEFRRNDKKRESLLNWDASELRRDASASNSVVTTWQISFERIRQERRSAADLLSLMSFFNSQGIPESTLRRYNRRSLIIADLDDEDAVDSAFNEDLDTLHAYSLVSVATEADLYEMHALVQFCTKVWLSSFGEAEQWVQCYMELMAAELPAGEHKDWAKCQQLLPHVEPLFDSQPTTDEASKAWTQVLDNAAWYLQGRGNYYMAQQVATKALVAREILFGIEDVRTLHSAGVLAVVLREQGEYQEAEALLQRALEGLKKKQGAHHPDTLASAITLAVVLTAQGKYNEAETLYRQVLEEQEREPSARHFDKLVTLGNLATVLRDQAKYEEAETLQRRALNDKEMMLGACHPSTLTSVDNLAWVLQDQGKYEEAETLCQRVLQGREKELGACHPHTLRSAHNYAYLLHTLARYNEAAELYQRASDGLTQQSGSQHPWTVECRNNFSVMQREVKEANLSAKSTARQKPPQVSRIKSALGRLCLQRKKYRTVPAHPSTQHH
jgi:tetratricopeptide (TPR) repeat protein